MYSRFANRAIDCIYYVVIGCLRLCGDAGPWAEGGARFGSAHAPGDGDVRIGCAQQLDRIAQADELLESVSVAQAGSVFTHASSWATVA